MRTLTCNLCFLFCLLAAIAEAQNTNISGVINTYTQVTALGSGNCIDTVFTANATGFSVDDTVMIIQMKGADIDLSNTPSFGSILNYDDAGNYEICEVKNVIGNTIVLQTFLSRTYTVSGMVQLIKVPYYSNATVTASLFPQTWNGTTGGVLAFNVAGNLLLNADITATGKGFKGGQSSINYYTAWFTAYYCTTVSGRGGEKGEGIFQLSTTYQCGRGCAANGGGAGTDINTGGAGGGNGGLGGHGGNNFYAPQILWGESGYALTYTPAFNKIFLGGGGGGGGHQNNSGGTDGADGAGIIFISSASITGNGNKIVANGNDVFGVAGIDGAGGAGAGGVVYINANTISGNLTIEVKGGKGGDQNYPPQCHGNGGGGGGGSVLYTGAAFPPNVSTILTGGLQGVGQCNNSVNDADTGQLGLIVYNWIPAIGSLAINAGPDTSVCQGSFVQIGPSAQPGLSYQWSNGVTTSNQLVNPVNTTTYVLTVSNTTCLNASDSVVVNVLQHPVAAFNFTVNCKQVSFTNNSSGTTSQTWYFGNGDSSALTNPVYSYAAVGNYTVTLVAISSNGCIDSLQQVISITGNSAQAAFNYTLDTCTRTISFSNASINAISYFWNFGDTTYSTLANPVHQYAFDGTFIVSLISISQCDTDSVQIPIQIISPLVPVVAFNFQVDYCAQSIQLFNQSVNGTSYNWNFGDSTTSTIQNPSHSYAASGNYVVTLIVSNSCFADSIQVTVSISSILVATASFNSVITPCSNSVTFINNSVNAISYSWYFGDGSTDSIINPQHLYSNPQIYNVMLIASDSCTSDTLILTVDLTGNISANANFSFNAQPCDSTSVQFNNLSQNGISYQWFFGDGFGDTISNPLHIYSQPGFYYVTLIATNACDADTMVIPITVDSIQIPLAQFAYIKGACTGEISFTNSSSGATTYLWLFGDGDTSSLQNPIHIYKSNGTYLVQLIANPNTLCADTFNMQVEVTEADTQQFFAPNCFTPNGDAFNDTFKIKGFSTCMNYHIEIYNRWGQLVYSADNLYTEWNGKYNNTDVPEGVYYYIIQSESTLIKTGNVTVLR